MIGVNLLLVAWWSFAMWLVTRMSRFVERRLNGLRPNQVFIGSHVLGEANDSDALEEEVLYDRGMSGLRDTPTVHRLAGVVRNNRRC